MARSKTQWLTIWRGPSVEAGKRCAFPTKNPVGQDLEFLVAKTARDENGGRLAPDPAADQAERRRRVGAHGRRDGRTRIQQRIVVDLSDKTLRYYRTATSRRTSRSGSVARDPDRRRDVLHLGAGARRRARTGPYGVFALGLSGFSPVLKDWPGGGRMAIHGTAHPGDRGLMVSHGCVRVYNDDMVDLRHVPLGTPVVIKR